MASFERTIKAFREINHLVGQTAGLQQQIDQLRVNKQIAERTGTADAKQMVGMQHTIDGATESFEKLLEMVRERTGRASIDDAMFFVEDFSARIENAQTLRTDWRKRLANLELAATLGEFDPEPESPRSRAAFEDGITRAKERYEQQLELAWAMVPDRAIIIGG